MVTYKVIPGPINIQINSSGNADKAITRFSDLMNAEAKDGWCYHSMEVITVTRKTGFWIFKHVEPQNYYMLIFTKEV